MEKLVAIALGISAMSMFLSSAAIWPHSQRGLEKARNGFLWAMFAFIAVGGGTISYRKLLERRRHRVRPTATQAEFANHNRLLVPSREVLPVAPVYDRLDLRPRGGIAHAPSREPSEGRLYDVNYNASYRAEDERIDERLDGRLDERLDDAGSRGYSYDSSWRPTANN